MFKNCDISVISYQIARSLSNESEAIGEGLMEEISEDGAEGIEQCHIERGGSKENRSTIQHQDGAINLLNLV